MKKGEIIYAKTHVEFLNKTFGTKYKRFMQCIYNYSPSIDVWMIELKHCKSDYGFYNYLIDENTLVERCDKVRELIPSHRIYVGKTKYQIKDRAVFAILNKGEPNRKYKFIGIFTLDEATMTDHIWKKVRNEL